VDIEPVDVGKSLRAGFAAHGCESERLVWMRHDAARRPGPSGIEVQEVPYDATFALRASWLEEDFPNLQPRGYFEEAREVARTLGARVFAVLEAGSPVAYAQLDHICRSAEIAQVYVRPDRRGRGLGTALTSAAIDAAGDVDELWIVADDEGRPTELYARLGFRPAATMAGHGRAVAGRAGPKIVRPSRSRTTKVSEIEGPGEPQVRTLGVIRWTAGRPRPPKIRLKRINPEHCSPTTRAGGPHATPLYPALPGAWPPGASRATNPG
jgi:GNAT superfamily N-acetyltransferase